MSVVLGSSLRKNKLIQAATRQVLLTSAVAVFDKLQPRPEPTDAWAASPEEAAQIRRLNCRHYDTCLDFAIGQDWRGFGCSSCTAHEPLNRQELQLLSIRLENSSSDIILELSRRVKSRSMAT